MMEDKYASDPVLEGSGEPGFLQEFHPRFVLLLVQVQRKNFDLAEVSSFSVRFQRPRGTLNVLSPHDEGSPADNATRVVGGIVYRAAAVCDIDRCTSVEGVVGGFLQRSFSSSSPPLVRLTARGRGGAWKQALRSREASSAWFGTVGGQGAFAMVLTLVLMLTAWPSVQKGNGQTHRLRTRTSTTNSQM